MKKRLFAIALALLLVVQLAPIASAAEAETWSLAPVRSYNPLYPDRGTAAERYLAPVQTSPAGYPLDSYISDPDEAAAIIRDALEARESTINIHISTLSEIEGKFMDELLYAALEETDSPSQGDYLAYHWNYFDGGATITYQNGKFYNDLSYTVYYYTDAEQEEKVDKEVEAVIDRLGLRGDMSDYEKVCAIYDYMCENIVYDEANLENKAYTLKFSAYAALINGTAVCQGYASLFLPHRP